MTLHHCFTPSESARIKHTYAQNSCFYFVCLFISTRSYKFGRDAFRLLAHIQWFTNKNDEDSRSHLKSTHSEKAKHFECHWYNLGTDSCGGLKSSKSSCSPATWCDRSAVQTHAFSFSADGGLLFITQLFSNEIRKISAYHTSAIRILYQLLRLNATYTYVLL